MVDGSTPPSLAFWFSLCKATTTTTNKTSTTAKNEDLLKHIPTMCCPPSIEFCRRPWGDPARRGETKEGRTTTSERKAELLSEVALDESLSKSLLMENTSFLCCTSNREEEEQEISQQYHLIDIDLLNIPR